MEKLYQEYFFVPKDGKISEKVILARMVSMVVGILLCLIGISLTAYAYFSHSVTTSSLSISAAQFDLNVSVEELLPSADAALPPQAISLTTDDEGEYRLEAGKTYLVKLSLVVNDRTAATGFSKIIFTDENGKTAVYHTLQLYRDPLKSRQTFSFPLQISPEGNVKARFISHWGTSSKYEFDISDSASNYVNDSLSPVTPTFESVSALDPGLAAEEWVYVVQAGDYLESIAQSCGVPMERIIARNGIENPSLIHPGQEIIIPSPTWNPEP